MTIYGELLKLYEQCPQRSLSDDLAHYMEHGYVHVGPDFALIGKREGDGWFVHCAIGAGALDKFWQLMPYHLPHIGWAREARGRQEIVWHRTETIKRLIDYARRHHDKFEVRPGLSTPVRS